ncbi:hypothetical protein M0R45_028497 [Rubus argutus]|uniref:CTLH domain-containing protein n=1 Tax=Rubus argutus TaxID=59490 RepID=A0AAW1W7G4_RUBAR
MSNLSKELVLLMLQFLDEEKFSESLHKLEQESGFFFNMNYFEEKIQAGEWEEVEKYLSGFTKFDDNRYSMKILFEITKQKYLEALDRQDKVEAIEILVSDLKKFSAYNAEVYKEITQLLTLQNFRENAQLSQYGDTRTARSRMVVELKRLVQANPLFRDKLGFPTIRSSRLRTLINQSLNWQHQQCKHPILSPEIKTLFTDHFCPPPLNGPLTLALVNPPSFPLLARPAPSPSVGGAFTLIRAPGQDASLKRPRTTPAILGVADHPSTGTENENLEKQLGHVRSNSEGMSQTSRLQASWSVDALPRTVAFTLRQGSTVTSMDFHPSHHILLLVGSSSGEISLWELGLRQRLASKPFNIWDVAACSLELLATVAKEDTTISVSRVAWSPDGKFVGVAFTKNLIHLYAYLGSNDLSQHLEIDAHVGGVNDLVFDHRNKELCVVTCGDDKLIKVWDLAGRNLYNFDGHEAPVYSVCPHHNKEIQFIFSTSTDGKIKTWMYDNGGPRAGCNAPGNWCTTFLFSADGSRMFSCGTSKEGDSFLVEWSENEGLINEGAIKRIYSGFSTKSEGVVHFDTTRNHFLAVGEDSQIKFWDMNIDDVLTSTDAEGGLPSLPLLRFNREGNLLAVTTADDGFKILANAVGLKMFKVNESTESATIKASGSSSVANVSAVNDKSKRGSPVKTTPSQNGADNSSRSSKKLRIMEEVIVKSKTWQLTEIQDPAKCRISIMPERDTSGKVVRLLYTSLGTAILALGSNGIQQLWRWPRGKNVRFSKASASVVPQLVKADSGVVMVNDVSGVNLEEAFPCIALSKNDSYVMSAYGGKIKLFNIVTLDVMTTFVELPPAPTFIAFHPRDNNIIAIGMGDCTIRIFFCRFGEVRAILKYHRKRITSLAFSSFLGVLVSADANGQVCMWSIDTWVKRKSVYLFLASGKAPVGATQVQFHCNQIHILVFHETQLAIYDASKLDLLQQWLPQGVLPAPISHAAYSCDSRLIYAAFCDGNIGVFDANTLRLRCRIAPSAYLAEAVTNDLYPLVIAANPQVQNQFAVGLADGSVKVIEPAEAGGGWGSASPIDDEASSSTINNHSAEQVRG